MCGVVNISSIMSEICSPFGSPYSASKAAVAMITDGLRMELAPFGIHVVHVKPGAIRSSIADNTAKMVGTEYDVAGPGSAYEPIKEFIQKRMKFSQMDPTPTKEFTDHVIDRLPAKPITIRYGKLCFSTWLVSLIPASWRDWILSRKFGLDVLTGIIAGEKKKN